MYSVLPNIILGFHGCDEAVAEKVLAGQGKLISSKNKYDWLGNGTYFSENNPERALDWAREIKGRTESNIKKPAVVGAIIYPGKCLNLTEMNSLSILKAAYKELKDINEINDFSMPKNQKVAGSEDLLKRYLDCAVIEMVHSINDMSGLSQYDTVRGVFIEGKEIYPEAGIKDKTHIQICVRNSGCIKGYFRVEGKQ